MSTTSNKRKKAVAATVAAAALLLAGTFAWTSISQQALNESAGVVNVGGRLHDDFNGTNKDVYVENFTDPLDGGQPIFARVKLTEYMEVGPEAGQADKADRNAEPVVEGRNINDEPETWPVHMPEELCAECETGDTCRIHDHWSWTMGGEDQTGNPDGKTTFMPTFNKDKDSLKAETNGTYNGTNPDDKVYYDDYVVYSTADGLTVEMQDTAFTKPDGAVNATPLTEADGAVTTVKDIAYYDDDTDKEDNNGTLSKEETHTAKETATAKVITMDEWLALPKDQCAGNFWVYDKDGWAYWANPIMPGQATGLLLDKIEMTQNPGEKCYYAINVVGQFATKGDWEPFELEGGGAPTENGMAVLQAAVDAIPTISVTYESPETIEGVTVTDRRAIYRGGKSTAFTTYINDKKVSNSAVKYSRVYSDGTIKAFSSSGSYNLSSTVTEDYVTVLVESIDYPGLSTVVNVPVKTLVGDYNDLVSCADSQENRYNGGTPIEVDGITWMPVGYDGAATLIVAMEPVAMMAFDEEGTGWRNSDVREYLNNKFLDSIPQLRDYVVPYALPSAVYTNGTVSYDTSVDRVFLLSYDEIMERKTQPGHMTVNNIDIGEYMTPKESEGWLRSAASGERQNTWYTYTISGNLYLSAQSAEYNKERGVYPAMWINMTGEKDVTDITANNVSVTTTSSTASAGGQLQFNADVRWNNASVENQKVTWDVEGGREGTSIDSNGLLSVSVDETVGNVLTITATAEEGSNVKGSATVAVGEVKSITISAEGNATEIIVGEKLQFSASPSVVTWSVSGNDSEATKIDETTGLLTMGTTEETKETVGKVLTITATVGDVSATYELTVVDVPKYVMTLTTPDGEVLTDAIYSDLTEQHIKVNLAEYNGRFLVNELILVDTEGSGWLTSYVGIRNEQYVVLKPEAFTKGYVSIKIRYKDPENSLISGEKIFDLKDASERPTTGDGE